MNTVRRVLGLAAGLLLAGFTLAAGAAEPVKIYSLNVSALGVAPVAVTIKNETPNGNSTVNSFIIKPPAGVSVTVASPASSAPATVTKNLSNGWIYVNAFTGLQAGNKTPKSITIFLNATYPGSGTCSSFTWTAQVYTGNSWGQETFALVPGTPPTNPTQAGPSCNLTITTPTNVTAGVPMTSPVVSVLNSGGSPVTTFGGSVYLYLGSSCPAGFPTSTGSPLATTAAVAGVATFSGVVIPTAGTQQITACTSYQGSTFFATSGSFMAFSGTLKCEPGDPYTFDGSDPSAGSINDTGFAEGRRSVWNKDGSLCVPVAYTFTNDILSNNSVTLTWDPSQLGAAFMLTMTWKPEYVSATTGMPERVTLVKWGTMATAVPGRACIAWNPNGAPPSHYLPAPYGTLSAPITSAGQATIDVSVSVGTLPVPPFPITIGNERLTVTGIAGSTWSVNRGQGGTTAAASVASGAYVMSNPLPLDGSGIQMQMCIAEEGWASTPAGANDCPVSTTPSPTVPVPTEPRACVIFTTTVYDIGDGFISRGGN